MILEVSNVTEVPRSEVYKVDRSSTGSVVKPTCRKTSQRHGFFKPLYEGLGVGVLGRISD